MSTAPSPRTMAEYVQTLADASPTQALQIAIQETERQKALASQQLAEYKVLSEIEFDSQGRIVKATMGGLWRLAQMYAQSAIVPEIYQGKPNDCFIACQMAMRLRIDPFAYMQHSYVVYGRPGVEAKLGVAMLNMSGKIKGRIRYEHHGELDNHSDPNRACTAIVVDADSGEERKMTVTWQMAINEGWVEKKGSKWKTIPLVMFQYRSASWLIKAYYPEVTMGIEFVDELRDVGPALITEDTIDPKPATLGDLADRYPKRETATDPAPTETKRPVKETKRPKDETTAPEQSKSEPKTETPAPEETPAPAATEAKEPEQTTAAPADRDARKAKTAEISELLSAGKTVTDFMTIKNRYKRDEAVDDEMYAWLSEECDRAMDAIRGTRGEKANGK